MKSNIAEYESKSNVKHLQFWMLIAFLAAGCGGAKDVKRANDQEQMALGRMDRESLFEYPGFKDVYDHAAVSEPVVQMIQTVDQGVSYVVVLGTWCSDSKHHVPVFLKTAEEANIPSERITLYGVDRAKQGPDSLPQKYHIEKVPTIIFLKDGNEIGRIVETPTTTVEADMFSILADAQAKK